MSTGFLGEGARTMQSVEPTAALYRPRLWTGGTALGPKTDKLRPASRGRESF